MTRLLPRGMPGTPALAVLLGAGFAFPLAALDAPPAQRIPCTAEPGGLHSHNSGVSTNVLFVNATKTAKSVYWLNYGGQRVFYRILGAGQSYVQQTYVTHPWIITEDGSNACVAMFLPRAHLSVARLQDLEDGLASTARIESRSQHPHADATTKQKTGQSAEQAKGANASDFFENAAKQGNVMVRPPAVNPGPVQSPASTVGSPSGL